MKAIVAGMIATYPVGGMFWDYVQYALGLEKLGFDVYYLEDTGLPTYLSNPDRYLKESLSLFSPNLGERWHYRSDNNEQYGMDAVEFYKIIKESDIFLNVSGGCLLRDSYMDSSRKILIDTDPGLNHFVNYPKWDKDPGWQGSPGYREHDYFFTYAENIGKPECILPDLNLDWLPTRPPVILECWNTDDVPSRGWTTVMSWNPYQHYKHPIEYKGVKYGAKEMEFERVEQIPQDVNIDLELAIAGNDFPKEKWEKLGWQITDAGTISSTPRDYQKYIQSSRGEFSVAKNIYVETHCGWFSTRSICYLAAGRPVVLQDTGFSKYIPTGDGVLAFTNLSEAVNGIKQVEKNYNKHSEASREIARTHFNSEVVLKDILNKVEL